VGRVALDDTAGLARAFGEVDFAIEATAFERCVNEMLCDPSLNVRS